MNSDQKPNKLDIMIDGAEEGDVIMHDESVTASIEQLDRLLNATELNWTPTVIDAYLNKNAPISYCCKKLNLTEEEFMELISS